MGDRAPRPAEAILECTECACKPCHPTLMWQCAGAADIACSTMWARWRKPWRPQTAKARWPAGRPSMRPLRPGSPRRRLTAVEVAGAASSAPSTAFLAVRIPVRHVAAIMFDSVNDACGSSSRTCIAFLLVARVHRSLARPVLCQDQSCLPAQHEVNVCAPFPAMLLFACKLSAQVWTGV